MRLAARLALIVVVVLGLGAIRGSVSACDSCDDLYNSWSDAMDNADGWIAQYDSDYNGLQQCTTNACTIEYETWLADDGDQIGFWTGIQVGYLRGARTLHCPWAV